MQENHYYGLYRSVTLIFGVRGSKPVPADAKLTPVLSSSVLRVESRYGGTESFTPTYLAAVRDADISAVCKQNHFNISVRTYVNSKC